MSFAEHAAASPARPEELGRLRRWVVEQCKRAGVPVMECKDVVLAASEALSNVVMHAYIDRRDPGEMRIRARVAEQRLHVEVEDDGVGIRPRVDSPGAEWGSR